MGNENLRNLPYMLYADKEGQIYDHPYLRMAGLSGSSPARLKPDDLISLPEFSKLFFIPDCPPIGLDPSTGEYKTIFEIEVDGVVTECFAVAAFLEPGLVRSHLPAVDYGPKSYTLPMWAYTAVGFMDGSYRAAGFRIEYNHKWDPKNYDDRELVPAIEKYRKEHGPGPLVDHLINCATLNHCFAAKNLFLKRWEAPLPVSRVCNAACLGCLSFQPEGLCEASHDRICFKPSAEEIVALSVNHLNQAPDPIVSFGQGCEGEPLTEYRLVSESIRKIRERTAKGTINLNTNGSMPERVRE
ncbi:MAG: radical SAM protein, partial [Bacteroidetes bacterium]